MHRRAGSPSCADQRSSEPKVFRSERLAACCALAALLSPRREQIGNLDTWEVSRGALWYKLAIRLRPRARPSNICLRFDEFFAGDFCWVGCEYGSAFITMLQTMNSLPIFDGLFLKAAAGADVFTYFAQSNAAGKFVIFILILCSILAWTVMIGKALELARLRQNNTRFQSLLSEETHILGLDPSKPIKGRGPYLRMTREALGAFFRYGGHQIDRDSHRASLRMGHVENALQRALAEQVLRYESKMVMLASIVTGAPFLGLLGTVWGVMDAFGGMAGAGTASLQSLAPGVSGALLTTVAGLLVAIPSVFGYNYLLQTTKIAVMELENFASMLADRIELEAQAASEDEYA